MPITATGIGSGLDVESIVSQLVLADIQPSEQRLNRNEAKYQSQLSAYGFVKGSLSSLQTAVSSAGSAAQYVGKQAKSSQPSIISVTATSQAEVGEYVVETTALATAQSLASIAFSTTTDEVGLGSLSISLGTTDYDSATDVYASFTPKTDTTSVSITIDSSNNTLSGVRDAINAADVDVTAAIINDGVGYRLVLRGVETGAENSISISVVDTGDSNNADAEGLSRLAFDSGSTNLVQTQSASDAQMTINGLGVTSSSNMVNGAVEGVSFTLKEVTSNPVTITISKDVAKAKAAVKELVNGYNEFVKSLNQVTRYDPDTATRSVLTGDSTLRGLARTVRASLDAAVENSGGSYSRLSELGISTNVLDGTLTLDDTKIDSILASDATDVAKVLAAFATPTNTNVRFVSSTSATEVGSYAVVGSESGATAGTWTAGSAVTVFTYNGGGNDANFDVTVDGAETISVNVNGRHEAAGPALDEASLIDEIQLQLDTLTTTSATVAVINGVITFTSGSTGAASTITVSNPTGDTSNSGLGIDSGTSTFGDPPVTSYTLNGDAVTESNGLITGLAGTAVEGLTLQILGNASGDLGTVSFKLGLANPLNALITDLLAEDGLLDARLDGIAASITDLTKQRDNLELRASTLENRYRNQFNGLETLISQLNTTQSFLTTALSQFVEPLSFRK